MLDEVTQRLGDRQLVWAGIRGDDIEPLADVPQLSASFSIVSAYDQYAGVQGVAYENLTGIRVDPEVWDIDEHPDDEATREFRHGLLRALSSPSALLPYRPSQFLSAAYFARRDRCLNLGLSGAHQAGFEHKPWVESEVADLGIPHVPWLYVSDEEQLSTRTLADAGPLVLRRSRTSGGEGFLRVDSLGELMEHWPKLDEAFVSVAPFLDGGIPVNVGATVWRDGVTVQHPSVQLIGVPSLVTREFGYCGNDYGTMRDLDVDVVQQIDSSTRKVADWLRGKGYLGTFGIDFLVHEGRPLFMEINARFQGSTHASCRLSAEADEACLMLEHVAAWLDVPCPPERPLIDLVRSTPDLANVVVHWTGEQTQTVTASSLYEKMLTAFSGGDVQGDVLVPHDVASERGSVVGRFTVRERMTSTGYAVDKRFTSVVDEWFAQEGRA